MLSSLVHLVFPCRYLYIHLKLSIRSSSSQSSSIATSSLLSVLYLVIAPSVDHTVERNNKSVLQPEPFRRALSARARRVVRACHGTSSLVSASASWPPHVPRCRRRTNIYPPTTRYTDSPACPGSRASTRSAIEEAASRKHSCLPPQRRAYGHGRHVHHVDRVNSARPLCPRYGSLGGHCPPGRAQGVCAFCGLLLGRAGFCGARVRTRSGRTARGDGRGRPRGACFLFLDSRSGGAGCESAVRAREAARAVSGAEEKRRFGAVAWRRGRVSSCICPLPVPRLVCVVTLRTYGSKLGGRCDGGGSRRIRGGT